MAKRDMATTIVPDITVASTDIIDTQTAESITYILETVDGTSVAFEDGDDSGLSDAADVEDKFLIVGDAVGAVTGNDVAYDAVTTANIGYVGKKRYVRATVTTPATNAAICVVKGDLLLNPGV